MKLFLKATYVDPAVIHPEEKGAATMRTVSEAKRLGRS